MKNCFNELVSYYLTENIGLGPMQFTSQNTYVFFKKKKSASKKKKRSKRKNN